MVGSARLRDSGGVQGRRHGTNPGRDFRRIALASPRRRDERLIGKPHAKGLEPRIASSEMFLNAEPLPHVICSLEAKERGGDGEAIKHGNA